MSNFDPEQAKKNLAAREQKQKEEFETERKKLLQKAITELKTEFSKSTVEVYLIGSVLIPFKFSPRSDIDIVLKNFTGDRFDTWARLERHIGRTVEIIIFESCSFQDFILTHGLKVL